MNMDTFRMHTRGARSAPYADVNCLCMSSKKDVVVFGGERCRFLWVEEDFVVGEVLRTYERVLRTPVLRTDWLMLISPTGRFFHPGHRRAREQPAERRRHQ